MATNPTDDEIDTEIDRIEQRLHDEFLVSPEIYVRLEALIKSKAHTDAIAEQERRYKIHEKYHELNDKDIEIKAHSEGYKEGQKDTANQIFAELDAAAWQQIEPDKLKQFYKEFSEAKDEKAALEIAKKYSIIGFSAEKYDNVKKEYKVD